MFNKRNAERSGKNRSKLIIEMYINIIENILAN